MLVIEFKHRAYADVDYPVEWVKMRSDAHVKVIITEIVLSFHSRVLAQMCLANHWILPA